MTDLFLSSGAAVTSPPVVRVVGLPAGVLDRLRFEHSAAGIDELIRLRAWLRQEADDLSDELYGVIGGLADHGLKPALVGLRRALHQGRRPNAAEWGDAVRSVLPGSVAQRIDTWLDRLVEHERGLESLPGVLAAETIVKESELRDIARSPEFRRALSQAGPSLFGELSKWLADERDRPRRQTLIRLAKFLSRASAKTSPYSTFTISGLGTWTDSEHESGVRLSGRTKVSGVLELQGSLLRDVILAVCLRPGLSATLPLKANPTVTADGGRLSFIGLPPDESIVTVPAIPAIDLCLRVLRDEPYLTRDALRSRLLTAGMETSADPDTVDAFLRRLVDMGLLIRDLPVSDQAADPLAELSGWLRRHADPETAEVVPILDRLRAELHREVPIEDVEAHVGRQHAVHSAVDELIGRLGLRQGGEGTNRKGIFHENAVFTGSPARLAAPRWRAALEDLDAVRHWLAPFSPSLPLKLALGTYCAERFGSGARIALLSLYRAVHEELTRGDGTGRTAAAKEMVRLLQNPPVAVGPLAADSPLDRLRELAVLQEQARQSVLALADPSGAIRLPASQLADLTPVWPSWVTPLESLACYVQAWHGQANGDPDLSLVLNVAHAGFGRGRTRVEHLVRRAGGGTAPHEPLIAGTPDRIPAEFGAFFGSAINVRVARTPYELDYPFTHSDRPAEERIALSDLVAVHDPQTDLLRLVSATNGAEVTPLHLGMMADILLPPFARLIAGAFGPAFYLHSRVSPFATAAALDVPETVLMHPRVTVGRVVLRRRRWVAPTALVPVRAKSETAAGHLLRMAGWLRSNGIPERCYVRAWADTAWDDEGPDARSRWWALEKSRKPIFVDFANWFLVEAFNRSLSGVGPVVIFEEALPDPGDTTGTEGHGCVAEFLVEISDKKVSA